MTQKNFRLNSLKTTKNQKYEPINETRIKIIDKSLRKGASISLISQILDLNKTTLSKHIKEFSESHKWIITKPDVKLNIKPKVIRQYNKLKALENLVQNKIRKRGKQFSEYKKDAFLKNEFWKLFHNSYNYSISEIYTKLQQKAKKLLNFKISCIKTLYNQIKKKRFALSFQLNGVIKNYKKITKKLKVKPVNPSKKSVLNLERRSIRCLTFGNWEADFIIGKPTDKYAIFTMVELFSKKVFAGKIRKNCEEVKKLFQKLSLIPDLFF